MLVENALLCLESRIWRKSSGSFGTVEINLFFLLISLVCSTHSPGILLLKSWELLGSQRKAPSSGRERNQAKGTHSLGVFMMLVWVGFYRWRRLKLTGPCYNNCCLAEDLWSAIFCLVQYLCVGKLTLWYRPPGLSFTYLLCAGKGLWGGGVLIWF